MAISIKLIKMKNSVPWSSATFPDAQQPHMAGGYYIGKCRYKKCLSLQKVLLDGAVLNLFIVTLKYSLIFDDKRRKMSELFQV